jgi:hypothetical protein
LWAELEIKPEKAMDMSKSSASSPAIATANGWTPIEFFDAGSAYAQKEFLVWMGDHQGNEWFEVARLENNDIVSEARNSHGAVRAADRFRLLAFRLVEGPDRQALRRIFRCCAPHFPNLERRPLQPKLKFVVSAGNPL